MSLTTFGLSVKVGSGVFIAVQDCTEPEYRGLDPLDDSRHADTDGIRRYKQSGRKEYGTGTILVDVETSCPGIVAADAAVGGAAVAIEITKPTATATVVVTFNALITAPTPGANPLSGKQQITYTFQPTPTRGT